MGRRRLVSCETGTFIFLVALYGIGFSLLIGVVENILLLWPYVFVLFWGLGEELGLGPSAYSILIPPNP
jgi:hypothetical protein